MKKLLTWAALMSAFTGTARASAITFEDLFVEPDACTDAGCGMQPVPDGYSGFHWSGYAWVINKNSVPDTAYYFGTLGTMSLFTAYGADISFDGGSFDFNGAYLTAHDTAPFDLVVNGYRSGALIYSKTVTVNPSASPGGLPYFYTFNFDDVDTVAFVTGGARWVVIDNITINEPFDGESAFLPLRRKIEDLLASGALKPGGANSLQVKVAAAEAAAERGNTKTARNNLEAVAHEVRALSAARKLSDAQAAELTALVQEVEGAL